MSEKKTTKSHKCIAGDDKDAVIEVQITADEDVGYVCAQHFATILDELKTEPAYLLRALNSEGAKLLADNNLTEIIPKEEEVPKYNVELKNQIIKVLNYEDPTKHIIKDTSFTQTMKSELWSKNEIKRLFNDNERQFVIELNKIYADGITEVVGEIRPDITDQLVRFDMEKPLTKLAYESYIYDHLGWKRNTKRFILHKDRFIYGWGKWRQEKAGGVGSGVVTGFVQTLSTPETATSETSIGELEELHYDCRHFPDMKGIFKHYYECKEYMVDHGIWIQDSLLRKMLLALERDTPFILFGEPGDGKSAITNAFIRWVCFHYNGGADILENTKGATVPINPNMSKIPPSPSSAGTFYISKNIDESTNAMTLYGGFSPEIIASGKKGDRRSNIEKGIFARAMIEGKYIMLDELNRTDNETLGRLMGFLAEPFNFDVPEGKLRFWFKKSSRERSNLVIISTMNTGDVGNFKLSFAFKRRFKIIQVHYTKEEIAEISKFLYGYGKHTTPRINNNIKSALNSVFNMTSSELDEFIETLNDFLGNFTMNLFEITHEWVTQHHLITFGVGVAHCKAVLEDISLFMMEILTRKENEKYEISDLINENTVLKQIKQAVSDSIHENVIMAVSDENDNYKKEKMQGKVESLIDTLFGLVRLVLESIKSNIKSSLIDQPINTPQFIKAMDYIWKYNKNKKELEEGVF